jgi:hypothetical protein
MAKSVKLRQGTATEHEAFTGEMSEVTFDTTNNRIILHDGTTPGGIPMARLSDVPVDLTDLTDVDANLASVGGSAAFSGTTYTVTVASGTNAYSTGNKYYITDLSGASPTVTLTEGETYRFDQSDSTNTGHPLKFSTTANGTHDSGSEYTTGVTYNGVPGQAGSYTEITVEVGAPTLYYYCQIHSGMGSGQPPAPDWSTATLTYTFNNPNSYGSSFKDYFGAAVAISSTHAIVGAFSEDDAGELTSGKAYIFDLSDGSLAHTLDNPNPYGTSSYDYFGISTGISDTHAIVGAYKEDDSTGSNSGKAYIYDLSDGSLVSTLDNPNPYGTSVEDGFGQSVAISGDYAIVCANGEDEAGSNDSGKAYIFNVSDGSLAYTLDNPNGYGTKVDDYFGQGMVALSSTHAIVGTAYEDDAGGLNSGKAYIFDLSDGSLAHTLDNPNPYGTSSPDQFGWGVGISDNYAIVGGYGEDEAGGNDSGKAYIFNVSDGSLAYTLDNPNAYGTPAGDHFGKEVAISDTHAVVNARSESDAGGINSGKVYIYDLSDGSLVRTLDNPNPYGISEYDRFGSDVAISGTNIIVGAAGENDAGGIESGKAYIFSAPLAASSGSSGSSGPTPIWSLSGDSATFAAVTTAKVDTSATNYVALNHPTAMGNSWSIEDGSYAMLNNPNLVNDPTVANRAFNIWATDDLSDGLTFQYWIKINTGQPPVWEAQHGVTSGSTQAYSYSLSQSSANAWAWAGNGAYGYFGIPGWTGSSLDAAGWTHIAMELQSNGRFVHYINGVVASNEDANDLSGLTNKANIYFGSVHSWVTDIEIHTGGGIHNPDLLATPPGFTPPTRKQA